MGEISWKILTIGHLSRNRYWGESDAEPYHPVLATTTFICDEARKILVDPSEPIEEMAVKLQELCQVKPEDIDVVYSTHFHCDHRVDAEKYTNAVCYMSESALKDLQKAKERAKRDPNYADMVAGHHEVFRVCKEKLTDAISMYPLPGHTDGTTGLLFESNGKKVVIAGDTVMGVEYFEHANGYWFNENLEETRKSIRKVAMDADVIVPGHGDVILVNAHKPVEEASEKRADENTEMYAWRRLSLIKNHMSTCLLVSDDRVIVVNPLSDHKKMEELLYDESGIRAEQVNMVIFTDEHHRIENIDQLFTNAELVLAKKMPSENGLNYMAWNDKEGIAFTAAEGKVLVSADAKMGERGLPECDILLSDAGMDSTYFHL